MFLQYFKTHALSEYSYSNYMGINKKEFPKWAGWKIINVYKDEGIHVSEIQDDNLKTLVFNHWCLQYIKEYYDVDLPKNLLG